jgi:uncharacterized protein YaiE (UPF0345 family)
MFSVTEYFDGKVKPIAFDSGDLPATVGVMAAYLCKYEQALIGSRILWGSAID